MSARYYSKTKFAKVFDTEKQFESLDKKIKDKITGEIMALSPQYPSVQATRKNSKIAGVGKIIDFSRTDIDWLDFKFEKESIDRIITQPVEQSKDFPIEKFQKQASLFFERAKPILKKTGKIGLVLRKGMEEYVKAAKEHNFTLESQHTINQGKEEWKVLVFEKI